MIQILKKYEVWKIAALIILMTVFGAAMVNAGDAAQILPIKPVPNIVSGEAPNTENKRSLFHGGGFINRIGKDEQGENIMVINDLLKYLAPSVHYYSANGGILSISRFGVGKEVGYLVNQKKEITDLYLLDK